MTQLWFLHCDFDIEKLKQFLKNTKPQIPNPKTPPTLADTLLKITTETKWQTKDKSGRKTKLCFK